MKANADRIVLRRPEAARLAGWLAQLEARFDGMVRVTKSDLANFLIRAHADALSDAEVDALGAELYDEVRWLNWSLAKVRRAKKDGVALSLDELLVRRKGGEAAAKPPAKRAAPRPAPLAGPGDAVP